MHIKESTYSAFTALYSIQLSRAQTLRKQQEIFLLVLRSFIPSEMSLLVVPAGLFVDNMVRWIGEQIYVKNNLAQKSMELWV